MSLNWIDRLIRLCWKSVRLSKVCPFSVRCPPKPESNFSSRARLSLVALNLRSVCGFNHIARVNIGYRNVHSISCIITHCRGTPQFSQIGIWKRRLSSFDPDAHSHPKSSWRGSVFSFFFRLIRGPGFEPSTRMASAPSASRSEFIVGGKYRLVKKICFWQICQKFLSNPILAPFFCVPTLKLHLTPFKDVVCQV